MTLRRRLRPGSPWRLSEPVREPHDQRRETRAPERRRRRFVPRENPRTRLTNNWQISGFVVHHIGIHFHDVRGRGAGGGQSRDEIVEGLLRLRAEIPWQALLEIAVGNTSVGPSSVRVPLLPLGTTSERVGRKLDERQ